MRIHARRLGAFTLIVAVLAVGSVFAGLALGSDAGLSIGADHVDDDFEDPEQAPRWEARELSAPFAQAEDDDGDDNEEDGDEEDDDEGEGEDDDADEGDEETRVINITNPGDNVEYTLTAPGLEPVNPYVEVGENAEDAENPEVIRDDTVFGTIGGGAYDTYRFTGPIEDVRLDSENIDELEVRIDGEPVDPAALTAEETETPTATATPESTTTETTTAETTTETATATETTTATATPTRTETATATETVRTTTTVRTAETGTTVAPATTTGGTSAASTDTATARTANATANASAPGSASSTSGLGIVTYVLIGVISGLVLAGALVYAVDSGRGP